MPKEYLPTSVDWYGLICKLATRIYACQRFNQNLTLHLYLILNMAPFYHSHRLVVLIDRFCIVMSHCDRQMWFLHRASAGTDRPRNSKIIKQRAFFKHTMMYSLLFIRYFVWSHIVSIFAITMCEHLILYCV